MPETSSDVSVSEDVSEHASVVSVRSTDVDGVVSADVEGVVEGTERVENFGSVVDVGSGIVDIGSGADVEKVEESPNIGEDEALAGPNATEPAAESTAETETEPAPEPEWRPIVQRHRVPIGVATLVLMVGIVVRLGFHLSTLPVLAFATTAVALAVVDFAILRLPNRLVAPAGALVVLTCAVQAVSEHATHILIAGLEGAVGVSVFYLLLYVLSRGGLGLGDVKLGAVAGFLLASRNWQHVFNGTFLAYLITLVIAVAMMIRGRKKFPYGPGILAGTIAVMLLS